MIATTTTGLALAYSLPAAVIAACTAAAVIADNRRRRSLALRQRITAYTGQHHRDGQ